MKYDFVSKRSWLSDLLALEESVDDKKDADEEYLDSVNHRRPGWNFPWNGVHPQLVSSIKKGVDVVYLDFAQAFDSINRRRLGCKLLGYGVHPQVVSRTKRFLTDRTYRSTSAAAFRHKPPHPLVCLTAQLCD